MQFIKTLAENTFGVLFELISFVFPIFICAVIGHIIAFADFCLTEKDSEKYKTAKKMLILSAMLIYVPILALFIPILPVNLLAFPVILFVALINAIKDKSKMSVVFLVTGVVMIAWAIWLFLCISAVLSV